MTARQPANGHRPGPPRQAVNWAAQYQPGPNAPLRTCARPGCGGAYLDDEPSRVAHVAVFGHSPKPREPASPAKEDAP